MLRIKRGRESGVTESAKEGGFGGEGGLKGMLERQSEYIKTNLDSLCVPL